MAQHDGARKQQALDANDRASYGPTREETRGRPVVGEDYAESTKQLYESRAGRPSGQTFQPPETRTLKPWEPNAIGPKHRQVLALDAAGLSPKEISDITGYTESWISVIKNHPDAQVLRDQFTSNFVGALTDNVREHIEAHTLEAFGKVVDLMRNARSENVQQRSAFDILDRGGFKPKDVNVNTNVNLKGEDAKLIAEALRESGEPVQDMSPVEDSHEILSQRTEDQKRLGGDHE